MKSESTILSTIVQLLIILITSLFFLVVTLTPSVSAAVDPKGAACEGVKLTGGSCDPANSGASDKKINSTVKLVINLFSWVVGVAAVIMIMIGGFKYIVSTGDSNSINSAKNTILYAIVGLAIVLLAQIIVKFVIGRVA